MSDAEDVEDEVIEEEPVVKSKRVFINHIDSFVGKNIAKHLSKCVVGASLEGGEEEALNEEEKGEENKKENTYKIYGTVKNSRDFKKNESVTEVIKYETKEHLFEQLMECDVIIYDITQDVQQVDEACWAANVLHSALDRIDKPKTFILLSTVMTWAKTKPVEPDDPDLPFMESDFRRRKAHPNFRDHLAAEKSILKLGKTSKKKLKTYVICSGLAYGQEESLFHYLFKAGWHNVPELPVFGNGRNNLPIIHVKDLACVLQNIADQKPKVRYILAIDDSKSNLKQITRAVSKNLTTGKIRNIQKEDALLNKDISQLEFDMLMLDLRMDAAFVKEGMQIKWHCETGFVDNVAKMIKEFKTTRNLIPFKVCILGPPGVGKSTIAQQLAKEYKIHHIHLQDVISKALNDLEKGVMRVEEEKEKVNEDEQVEEEEDEEDDDNESKGQDVADLEAIKESMLNNDGRLENLYVVKFVRQRLLSKPCQNQGFILDGFPKTEEQAKDLFAPDESVDEEEALNETDVEEAGKAPKFSKLITPDIIIKLDASDEFIKNRIMNLPEKLIEGTHNTEEGLKRRLSEYRSINNEDETVTNVFEEEYELDVIKMGSEVIENDKSLLHKSIVDTIRRNLMKETRNYGLSPEEKEVLRKIELEERRLRERASREELERRAATEALEKAQKQYEWSEKLEHVKREEIEYLETQSLPLRNYLMSYVMPTLTKGLIECSKVRPDDPIDFISEYLFNCATETKKD